MILDIDGTIISPTLESLIGKSLACKKVNSFLWLSVVVKVVVLGVCVSPGYSCVVLCTIVMYLVSRFFSQLLLSRS